MTDVSPALATKGGYRPSPRPRFEGAVAIPYRHVARHVWGDAVSGEVYDWVYVSSDLIHQITFGLPPGGWFRHSAEFRTVFAADEVLVVERGVLVLANPQTGEVHKLQPGDAAFFGRDTWHHAFNYGDEELRVIEFMSPTPSTGAAGAYAREQDLLVDARYQRGRDEPVAGRAITVIRGSERQWRLIDGEQPALVGMLAETTHLAAGVMELRPGHRGPRQVHDGESSGVVLRGHVAYRPGNDGERAWHELAPGDGFFAPAGVGYAFDNLGSEPAEIVFGVGRADGR